MQDEPLPLWLPQLAVQGGPRFLQIADALQAAVADGSLKPGDRLPPQRRLAAQLDVDRSEEHTSELQSLTNLVCRLLLEKKKKTSAVMHFTRIHAHRATVVHS